jgi:twitching motility protein PilT
MSDESTFGGASAWQAAQAPSTGLESPFATSTSTSATGGPFGSNSEEVVVPPQGVTPSIQEVVGVVRGQQLRLEDLLVWVLQNNGSDLHLEAGATPCVRVLGQMVPVPNLGPLTGDQIRELVYSIMTERQRKRYEEDWELDFAHALPTGERFRVNVLKQRGVVGAVFRAIPNDIKTLESLGMPPVISEFAGLERGLVLVTGPTGSGKSTTLASLIDLVNRSRRGHIVTIEDPIEFLHTHRMSIVTQREVGNDTRSFSAALKHVLRQDPDVILVGEMRDLETISTALTAAETGHLVFATLHTRSTSETISRIIDVFPPEQQQQVRIQLASALQGVVCQTLCRTLDRTGRVAAIEIMVATPPIRALIRDNRLAQIPSTLQSGSEHGMQTLNMHLSQLVAERRISPDTASEKASDRDELLQLLARVPGLTGFSAKG